MKTTNANAQQRYYKISHQPIDDLETRYNLESKDCALYEKASENMEKGIKLHDTISTLKMLIEKYPHVPNFINNLAKAYELNGETEKAYETAEFNYQKFPDYLFAKLNKASVLLSQKKFDKIAEIFHGAMLLTDLYPDREIFYIAEVVLFHTFMVQYYLSVADISKAKYAYQILKQADPQNKSLREYDWIFKEYDNFLLKQKQKQFF